MRFFKRFLLIAAVVVAVLCAAVYLLGPSMILYPYRKHVDRTPEALGLPFEKISVVTPDSIFIEGYWVRQSCDTLPQTTIILLHGIGNSKENWLNTAQWLWEHGIASVMVDLRAHGESGGRFCTYGFREKQDISAVISYVLTRNPSAKVGIWGHSLGGAVAMQTLETDQRLQFGIVESTFAEFRDVVYDYQKRIFKAPFRALSDNAIRRAARKGGFNPDNIKPCESARRIKVPMLIAHGDRDEKISYGYGLKNYENLGSTNKQFYTVHGARHSNVAQVGGEAYKKAVLAFLQSAGF